MFRYPDISARASHPARLRLSVVRLRRLLPEAEGWTWLFGFREWIIEKILKQHLQVGDSRAAVVLSLDPLLVAAYSDELDCVAEYVNAQLGVRVTCGGPQKQEGWRVAIADMAVPDKWYNVSSLRCLLDETQERTLPYLQRFAFVTRNWKRLLEAFSDEKRAETHRKLKQLEAGSSSLAGSR